MASGQRPAIVGPGRPGRPSYPKWPLDPDCLEPGDPRPDVVELVRLVQTDFDPETDPTGWDSVADLVRGDGRPWDEVRQMDYHQLAAFFRNRHGRLKIQLGGAIETTTPSFVSYNAEPKDEARDKPCKVVLREWWDDPKRRQKILDAGSAEKIGHLIGFGETTVKEAKPIWNEIRQHLIFRRKELRQLEELRRAEEERLGG